MSWAKELGQRVGQTLIQMRSDTSVSRRSLLIATGLLPIAADMLLSCGNPVKIPDTIPALQNYLEYANSITNPYERAANVLLSGGSEAGHGSIYKDDTGVYLVTVKHLHPTNNWQIMVPGVAQNQLLSMNLEWEDVPNTTASTEHYNANADGLLKAKIPQNSPIIDAITQGIVSPLTSVKPHQGMHVAVVMSDIEGASLFHMELQGNFYTDTTNLVECTPSFPIEGRTCHGYSGAGVMLLDSSNNPTGEIIGLWAAGNPEGSDPPASQGSACSDTGGSAIPFIKP